MDTLSYFCHCLKKIPASFTLVFTSFVTLLPLPVRAYTTDMSISFNENWPPYSYRDESGEMKGILVDIAREVLHGQLNLKVSMQGFPWKRVQANVESGVNDAFISTNTVERQAYTLASSEAFYIMEERAFISKKGRFYDSLKTLNLENAHLINNYRVCDMLGNGWAEHFYKDRGIRAHYLKDINLCFRGIAADRFDIAIHISDAGRIILKNEGLSHLIEMQPALFDSVPFPLLVSKKSRFTWVIPLFDKAMAQYRAQGRIERVVSNYLK